MKKADTHRVVYFAMLTFIICFNKVYSLDPIWPYQSAQDIPYLAMQINNYMITENKRPYAISTNIFLNPIVLYQKKLSHSSCQYFPSCSRYTYLAIEKYGAPKGLILSAERLIRCSHSADQSRYPKMGPYFYDPLFDVFKCSNLISIEDSYEYHLASIISEKLNNACEPSEPVFQAQQSHDLLTDHTQLCLFPENVLQDSNLKFAIYLYNKRDYYQAATELKRYIFDKENYQDKIYLLIGSCHYYSKRYLDAILYFNEAKVHSQSRDFQCFCDFLTAISHFNNRNAHQSEQILLKLLDQEPEPILKRNVILSLISLYLKINKLPEIQEIIDKNGFIFPDRKVQNSLENFSNNHKSKKLATLFSLVPGLGHFYSGSFREGAYSFVTHTVLGYLFYDTYRNGSQAGQLLSGALFVQFYSGNIIGGKRAAEVYNILKREKVNTEIQTLLKLAPEFKIKIANEVVYLEVI